jgi:hypothetical protein
MPATMTGDQAEALEPAQEVALAALLTGKPLGEAASAAGRHRSTLWRWLQTDPALIAAYNRGRRELADQARAELLTLGAEAVKAIREALESDDPGLRFRAAVKTLELLGCDGEPTSDPIDSATIAEALEKEDIDLNSQRRINAMFRQIQGG